MDYLRRLHPRLAFGSDAAVPDLGAWRVAGLPLGGDAAIDDASRASLRPSFSAETAAPPARTGAAPGSPPPPAGATHGDAHLPLRATGGEGRAPAAAIPAARSASPRESDLFATPPDPRDAGQPAHSARWMPASTHPFEAAPTPARHAPASPALPTTAPPQSALPIRGSPRPLAAIHDTKAVAPPVVHVSIDRIDVRIPSAPTAATRRASAVSTVGTLADYLRSESRRRP